MLRTNPSEKNTVSMKRIASLFQSRKWLRSRIGINATSDADKPKTDGKQRSQNITDKILLFAMYLRQVFIFSLT